MFTYVLIYCYFVDIYLSWILQSYCSHNVVPSKSGISSSFSAIFLYTPELYPTNIRYFYHAWVHSDRHLCNITCIIYVEELLVYILYQHMSLSLLCSMIWGDIWLFVWFILMELFNMTGKTGLWLFSDILYISFHWSVFTMNTNCRLTYKSRVNRTNTLNFIVLSNWNNSPPVDMSLYSGHCSESETTVHR
jgi:hypothetical protein